MKKNLLLLFSGTMLTTGILAQTTTAGSDKKLSKAKSNAIALGLSFPMGAFNRTHTFGLVADYFRSINRYDNDVIAEKLINFALNAGISYHAGKSANTVAYEFRYGGYLNMYAAAGIDYKPSMPVNISLTAGPFLSIYDGNADIGAGFNLFWSYFLSNNIAIGPGLVYRKQPKTDALWSATIRASYAF